MTAYIVLCNAGVRNVKVLKFADKEGADAHTYLEQRRKTEAAYVIENDNDLAVLNFTTEELRGFYDRFGELLDEAPGGELSTNLNTARQQVMMRLADYGRKLEETPPPAEDEWKAVKRRDTSIKEATDEYLSAVDDTMRNLAAEKLKKLGTPIPSLPKGAVDMAAAKKKAAKKSTKAKTNGHGGGRVAGDLLYDLPKNLMPPAEAKSGAYIRSLIMLGKSTEEIVELVKKHFKGSTAKGSDVSWNRAKLRAAGKKVPDAPRAAKE